MASSDSLPIATMIHMVTIKLSSSNYLLWKRQIMPMLTSFNLLGFVDGSSIAPAATLQKENGSTEPNPAYAEWHTQDQKLLGVLFSSLSEEAMAEVVDCTTSRATWLALEAAFSHASTSRANQLREQLLSLRRGSLSVQDYGKKFKTICDQLSAIGRSVDESDKSHLFLRGLGIQFANFTDTRMAMDPIPSFTVLLHQAVQFDLMNKAMEASPNQSQVAFTAAGTRRGSFSHNSSQSGSSARSSAGSTRRGYNQQQQSNGRGSSYNRQFQSSGHRRPRCQICRGEHYADRCPQYLQLLPPQSAALAQAFYSSCNISTPNSESYPDWYVDSGASAHITD